MKILVTGVAGFIGMHVSARLLERGDQVFGIDNLNDYYDIQLKQARLACLESKPGFSFKKFDICEFEKIIDLFDAQNFDRVIHLAAQAGVRYSIENPHAYINANVQGFINILEACRKYNVEHLLYASSSSVYGGNTLMPFSEHHNVDHPVSLYAATKKANELMAHSYSHLYNLPTTGLRFFTVYGPWGRPDMALFMFTKAMLEGRSIDVFNNGEMLRDFTFIDDIVTGVVHVLDKTASENLNFNPASPDPASSSAPYRVFNIGNGSPTPLMSYVKALEEALGIEALVNMLPMQLGDVPATSADTTELGNWVGFKPNTAVRHGVKKFVEWYLNYYDER